MLFGLDVGLDDCPLFIRALQTAPRSLAPALEALEGMVMVSMVTLLSVSGSLHCVLGTLSLLRTGSANVCSGKRKTQISSTDFISVSLQLKLNEDVVL